MSERRDGCVIIKDGRGKNEWKTEEKGRRDNKVLIEN